MSKLSISEAARLAGISRNHLYNKYINKGVISVITDDNKPFIDTSELLRVFPNAKLITDDTLQNNALHDTHSAELVSLLKEQLEHAKEQIAKAEHREAWLQSQIDELRQQHNNLLENKLSSEKPKRKKFLGIF